MDMLREKQLTVRATKRPVEYNYTNADIHHHETEPCDGYQLEYPVNWTGDPSTNKVIGIRRIDYKPTSLDIAVRFSIIGSDSEVPIDINMVFTDQNTFEECISKRTPNQGVSKMHLQKLFVCTLTLYLNMQQYFQKYTSETP